MKSYQRKIKCPLGTVTVEMSYTSPGSISLLKQCLDYLLAEIDARDRFIKRNCHK